MKKVTVMALACIAFIIMDHSMTYAQLPIGLSAGVRGGVLTKDNDYLGGAQVELKVPFITIVPNYEYVFVKNGKLHQVNLDLQYTLASAMVAKMFFGGGYVMQMAKPDISGADMKTYSGFNLQLGAKAGVGPLNVFALGKYQKVKKNDTFGLVLGTNFSIL